MATSKSRRSSRGSARGSSASRDEPKAPLPLRVALPKGRLLDALVPVLARAGLPTESLGSPGRRLVLDDPRARIRYFLLKPDDVPTYVEHGTCDLGVVGRDVLLERGHDLFCPLDLRLGRCRVVVAAPRGAAPVRSPRVATKYVQIAERYFAARGVAAFFVPVSGSVEIAATTGLADLVVDIVETGETLRQNHLEIVDTICEVTAVLVANRTALKLRKDRIAPLLARLRRAVRPGAEPTGADRPRGGRRGGARGSRRRHGSPPHGSAGRL